MKAKISKSGLTTILGVAIGMSALNVSAQTVTIGSATVAAGATASIPVNFTANGAVPVNSFGVQFTFTRNPVAVANGVVTITTGGVGGLSCGGNGTNNPTGLTLSTSGFDGGGGAQGSGLMCTFNIPTAASAPAGNYPFVVTFNEFTSPMGATVVGTVVNGSITISPAGVDTPPALGYTPNVATLIQYPAGGAGPSITVSNAGGGAGAGAPATTSLTNCVISVPSQALAFPTLNFNPNITAVGTGAPSPASFALPACAPQATQATATLTCTETRGVTAVVPAPTWSLNCPAAAPTGTPPNMLYSPAEGQPGITVPFNTPPGSGTAIISVGCPTDGAPCDGATGSGLTGTTRLEMLTATWINGSPGPTMACEFVNEATQTIPGAIMLDFVALTADPGDIRCTCPAINTTGLPTEDFNVSVRERRPASGLTFVQRNFVVKCGNPPPPPNCGTIVSANQAPGSIITLNNPLNPGGGAAVQVTALSLTGASTGVTQTATCLVTNLSAPATSTFTVSTAPSPLVLSTLPAPPLSGTVSATCTNTLTTEATATVTCSFASNDAAICANGAPVAFTLNCPGQGAPPPPVDIVPVPSLSEQGRILLAALVLLMGLGVVGFRMRG